VGSGGGGVVGSGVGDGGASLVGGAGGGFGVDVLLVGLGTGGRLVVARGVGGVLVSSAPPVGVGGGAFGFGLVFGMVRPERDAAGDFRAAGAGFTVPAGFTCEAGFWAGVAFAIAAARAPVAITEPAATPLLTSDRRRSARSRW
jgi:hypothetical protein